MKHCFMSRISTSALALVALAALSVPMINAHAKTGNPECASEDHYPLISKSELAKVASNKSATIIDVNSKESYDSAHVPTAVHYGTNAKHLAKILPADKGAMIVAYCGGVKCTAWKKAAERACNMGYTNIFHFKEGIKGWLAGNPGGLQ